MSDPILEVRDLKVHFPVKHQNARVVRAVDGVTFNLNRGEILSLVGESGSGKTTTGKAILRILNPTAGSVKLLGTEIGTEREDEELGKDKFHRIGRLICGIMELVALILSFTLPLVTVKGEAVEPFRLWELLFGTASIVTFSALIRIFAALIPLAVLAAVLMSLFVKKRVTLLAIPCAVSAFCALLLLLSLPSSMTFGTGALATMVLNVLSAAAVGVTHGLYTPAYEKDIHRHAQMIFQDPYQSLNPRNYIIDIVAEPLDVNGLTVSPEDREQKVQAALEHAGLQPARDYFYRYPYELSGGQRQRVAIAASLILDPDFIVADEPVSMIDASIRLGIVKLMKQMQKEQDIAFLFITHDLSLAWMMSDRIAIMYLGKIMEIGTADQIIKNCKHPYAKALMDVMPIPGMNRSNKRNILAGDIPSAANDIKGCKFCSRCPRATEKCALCAPELQEIEPGHSVACFYVAEEGKSCV